MACSVITRPTAVRVAHLISDKRSYARQIAYVGWDRIGCTSRLRGPGSGLLSSPWGSQGWIFRPFSHRVQLYPHRVIWEASGGQLTGGPLGSLAGAARQWGTMRVKLSPLGEGEEAKVTKCCTHKSSPRQLPWWGRIQAGEREVSRCTQHRKKLAHA
jgi:hypothetical protein